MTFKIQIPDSRIPERQYVFDVIFNEFLGLDYCLETINNKDNLIRIFMKEDFAAGQLILPDILFSIPSEQWFHTNSLPKQPLRVWDLELEQLNIPVVSKKLPLIYASNKEQILAFNENSIQINIDIFGSIFFMLTRYEELVKEERDEHDRFPAWASLAYQEGFLERPIVNEYLEILWWAIKRLWPRVERKQRSYRVFLSHDVDNPFSTVGKSIFKVLRTFAGDIAKRKDLSLGTKRLYSYIQSKKGNIEHDPNNTFEFIMNLSESHGLQSAFYFIAGQSSQDFDGRYSLDDPKIRGLIRNINRRGHEIGIHPSYNTYINPTQTKIEFEKLLDIAKEEGVEQNYWGGRQHYLRWKNPDTWEIWEKVGLSYDSTLTFADNVGFRCGTCYEYSVFDLDKRKKLQLKERPLIVMEGTLLSEQYMNYSYKKTFKKIIELKDKCRIFNGDFSLLWHNNSLIMRNEKLLYSDILKA